MKKGKYLTPRNVKRTNKKLVSLILALVLTIGGVVGGTLAWLTAETPAVTNTFAPSDINIELAETPNLDLKMVPGCDITKDPKVTVKAGSEACWLFVKIEESANYDRYLAAYTVADNWKQVKDAEGNEVQGVFYYDGEITNGTAIPVLKDNRVTVLTTVTKGDMEAIDGVAPAGTAEADIDSVEAAEKAARPTLTFTAYAIQKAKFDTAAAAWAQINATP